VPFWNITNLLTTDTQCILAESYV